jgi:hypothetical protein
MAEPTTLTDEEKRVIKAMIAEGMRNQDILTLINYERPATINFGRITGVKKNASISPASAEEVAHFKRRKRSFDPITGLNLYGDERLIRAREAMVLAVTIFNSGAYKFKTEVFAVLANIAWTYLLHEHYGRHSIPPQNSDGTTFALSYMLSRSDCPLRRFTAILQEAGFKKEDAPVGLPDDFARELAQKGLSTILQVLGDAGPVR